MHIMRGHYKLVTECTYGDTEIKYVYIASEWTKQRNPQSELSTSTKYNRLVVTQMPSI
jgi:hypothetical protein